MSDIDQENSTETSDPSDLKQLGLIVEQEARRVLSEEQLEANPDLVAEGWERRFIGDARQVKEAIELYTQLGYEVHTEPVQVDEMDDDCADCQILMLLKFQTIYTRKKRDEGTERREE